MSDPNRADTVADGGRATRVVVSFDASGRDDRRREWLAAELGREGYARYLRRAHRRAVEGDEWAEFVSRGCDTPVDVTLRVERVEGGAALGPDTTVVVEPR